MFVGNESSLFDVSLDLLIWFCYASLWMWIGLSVFDRSRLSNFLYYENLGLKNIKSNIIIVFVLLLLIAAWPFFLLHEMKRRRGERA